MEQRYLQLRWSTTGRLALARVAGTRLAAERQLARVGGRRLLLFNVVDDHIHAVVDVTGRSRRRFLQALTQGVRKGAGVPPLDPVWWEPVTERRHLFHLVRYIATQASHHGLTPHDATWSGGCLMDLLGARRLDGYEPAVLLHALPRLDERALLGLAGLSAWPAADVAEHEPSDVVDAALATVGHLSLSGSGEWVRQARVAGCQLAREAGARVPWLALALGTSRRTVYRALLEPAEKVWTDAILRQLALRTARGPRAPEPGEGPGLVPGTLQRGDGSRPPRAFPQTMQWPR